MHFSGPKIRVDKFAIVLERGPDWRLNNEMDFKKCGEDQILTPGSEVQVLAEADKLVLTLLIVIFG